MRRTMLIEEVILIASIFALETALDDRKGGLPVPVSSDSHLPVQCRYSVASMQFDCSDGQMGVAERLVTYRSRQHRNGIEVLH